MSTRSSSSAGFSIIEVVIAMVVLLVATLSFARAITGAESLGHAVSARARALESARQALENLQDVEFSELFARHDADGQDDPDGPNTAPGSGFDIAGLSACADDPDGRVGEFLFPSVDGELREDMDWPELGLPRDLNGDGVIDGLDHALDYQLLPVLVRVRWRGGLAPMQVELRTYLARR